jgi:hypothetical protein
MREKLLWFIAKFLIVSFVLFALWMWKAEEIYLFFLNNVIYNILTFFTLKIRYYYRHTEFFYSLIPFISLMVITQGVKLKKRILYLALGSGAIMGWHIFSYEMVFEFHQRYLDKPRFLEFIMKPFYLFSAALPFILWLLFLRKNLWRLFQTQRAVS